MSLSSPGFDAPGVVAMVRDALSPQECRDLVARAERTGFSPTGRDYPPTYRNNDRLVLDDPALARQLFGQLGHRLPSQLVDGDGNTWNLVGLNPRFRFCRYQNGQHFCVHQDGAHVDGPACSWLTLQVYLNDATGFSGGRTRFYQERNPASPLGLVTPVQGDGVLFEHQLWHDGEPVWGGTKHVLRTDVMYTRQAPKTAQGMAHDGYVFGVCALKDGGLASASRDTRVRIWREEQGGWACQQELRGHQASVTCVLEDALGRLWTGSRDRSVRVWNNAVSHVQAVHQGAVLSLCLLPDGRVASGGADGAVLLHSASGEATALPTQRGWMNGLAMLDDQHLVAASSLGCLHVWDLGSGQQRDIHVESPVLSVAARGGKLVCGLQDGRVQHWDAQLLDACAFPAHQEGVLGVAWTRGGSIVSAGQDGWVHVHERHGARLGSQDHGNFVTTVAVLEDGRVASGGYNGTICLWRP